MILDQSWFQKISEKILNRMEEKKLSPEQLSEKTGISLENIEHWLNGTFKNCGIIDIEKIARALSMDPNSLFHL